MKILMVHNYYQQPGGEDLSFQSEADLLEQNGHQVIRFTRDNREISHYSGRQKALLAANTIWSAQTFRQIEEIIKNENPDIAHFQNTFPLISPSALYACKKHSIPVVVSLRNYRLLCVNGLLLRNERLCEDCVGKPIPWLGILHKCYRQSTAQSAVVAKMLVVHRMLRTWNKKVDLLITPSEFTRSILIRGGIAEEKIITKPNFFKDPGERKEIGDYSIFVGRLSPEKGIIPLLNAIRKTPSVKLMIVGDGPLRNEVEAACKENPNIVTKGHLEHAQAMDLIRKARFLIYPTIYYETFGRSIIESYAFGVPVIVSNIGAAAELVRDGETGMLVKPGDKEDMAEKIMALWKDRDLCIKMGRTARQEYLKRYTPEKNYKMIMNNYQAAIRKK